VDAHVGAHLFQNCITGLLANKTRIFITNQLQYVPAVDLILVLKEGQLVLRGRYEDLMAVGNEFQVLMKNSGADSNSVAQGDLASVVQKGKQDYKNKKRADKVGGRKRSQLAL
jgi:ABC-type multidrug transport system ATPase subunit